MVARTRGRTTIRVPGVRVCEDLGSPGRHRRRRRPTDDRVPSPLRAVENRLAVLRAAAMIDRLVPTRRSQRRFPSPARPRPRARPQRRLNGTPSQRGPRRAGFAGGTQHRTFKGCVFNRHEGVHLPTSLDIHARGARQVRIVRFRPAKVTERETATRRKSHDRQTAFLASLVRVLADFHRSQP